MRRSIRKGARLVKQDTEHFSSESSESSSLGYDRFPTFNENKLQQQQQRQRSKKKLEEGEDIVNGKLFDKSKVRATEEIVEVENPLFKGNLFENEAVKKVEGFTANVKTEQEVFSLYQENQFYKDFANKYERKVEQLLNRLEAKSSFAFRSKMMHFTNKHNVYRPSGAAYAIARSAMKSRLVTRNDRNKRRMLHVVLQGEDPHKEQVLSKLKGHSLTPKSVSPRPSRVKYGLTTTGVKLTLEERIKWLEDGVPPSGRTREQLGIIIADGEVSQEAQLASKNSSMLLGRGEWVAPPAGEEAAEQGAGERLSAQEKRARINTYGKWYLRPEAFNIKNEKSEQDRRKVDVGGDHLRVEEEEALLQRKRPAPFA